MDNIRDKCIKLLSKNIIKDYCSNAEIENIVKKLELGIYKQYSLDIDKYRLCARKINSNIGNSPNALFVVKRLISGEWKPEDIALMSYEELYPERIEEEIQEKIKENNAIEAFKKFKLEHSTGSLITCERCKSNNVSYIEIQLKSSDEPMSLKCNCNNCGDRWIL